MNGHAFANLQSDVGSQNMLAAFASLQSDVGSQNMFGTVLGVNLRCYPCFSCFCFCRCFCCTMQSFCLQQLVV